jgi:hypothetical protein
MKNIVRSNEDSGICKNDGLSEPSDSDPRHTRPSGLGLCSDGKIDAEVSRDAALVDWSALMKIPRPRQNPHVARMADFLGWVAGVVAAVVVDRLGRHGAGVHGGFSAERVVG